MGTLFPIAIGICVLAILGLVFYILIAVLNACDDLHE